MSLGQPDIFPPVYEYLTTDRANNSPTCWSESTLLSICKLAFGESVSTVINELINIEHCQVDILLFIEGLPTTIDRASQVNYLGTCKTLNNTPLNSTLCSSYGFKILDYAFTSFNSLREHPVLLL